VSRVGRLPVTVPSGVQIDIQGLNVRIKGPKGMMERTFAPGVTFQVEDGNVVVARESDAPTHRALHGTARLINNMITGVSTGFTKVLEIDGVGYRAEMNGKNLMLFVGYSHPVEVPPPDGITFDVDTKTRQIKVSGSDKNKLARFRIISAASARPSHTMAKASATRVRRSAARLVNLVRVRAKSR
jgi:large subunit ribosomal protein L6